MPHPAILIGLFVGAIVLLVVLAVLARFFGLWLRATMSGAKVTFVSLIGMTLRNVSPKVIVDSTCRRR
jgi:uncharacterized protein YqfA (UPF0365 family)